MMHRTLALLVLLSAPALAEDSNCSAALFSSMNGLQLGTITPPDGPRVVLQGEAAAGCPDASRAECRSKATLAAKSVVVVGEERRGTRCVWFQPAGKGRPVIGWVDDNALTMLPEEPTAPEKWVGTYSLGKARITLVANGGSKLDIVGVAKGAGDKASSFQATGTPMGTIVSVRVDECAVRLVLMGRVLFADDNAKCGSPDVRFMGGFLRSGK